MNMLSTVFESYWDPEIILDLIKNLGMRVEYDATIDFTGSGAHYYKLAW